jgi:nicotinate-nucleotide adenylyltransferase
MSRIAFYGGSFDPPHRGHVAVAHAVLEAFGLDRFVFIPAFQAPHKVRLRPTSAYDRYAMLCLVTNEPPMIAVSRIEIDAARPLYSVETLTRLGRDFPDDELFFVIGADSWLEITTWREWESVLSLTNIIVVTRPGYDIAANHVTDDIRERIVDLRGGRSYEPGKTRHIYLTDAVQVDVSATVVRHKIRSGDASWRDDVPAEVAKYIEKYQIYS